ncbi:MAG: low affinity iron permease family protein [Bacteroidota bacterium]
MKKREDKPHHSVFERFASAVTCATGSTPAFLIALLVVIIWLASGPFFGYSDTWQLVINTGTTIITFLMVFLIQKSQNKDAMAIQLKLNELVAAHELASNRLVSVEDMTEEELKVLHKYYSKLAALSLKEETLQSSHSIEEANEIHEAKQQKKDAK